MSSIPLLGYRIPEMSISEILIPGATAASLSFMSYFATSGFSFPKAWIPCPQDFQNPDLRYAEKPVTLFRGPSLFLQRFQVISFQDFTTPVARPLLLRVPGI
jgi:hypothetical protein